jgi:Dynamin family
VIEDAIKGLEAIAYAVHDEAAATLARELLGQLPRGELNLLVVGQFKRGKSSLINALLGADVMPTGVLPVTGVATAIRYGTPARIEVFFRDQSATRVISVNDLALYVSEQNNPVNALGVGHVEVFWPSDAIRGLALFDTPGIGSTYMHNTAAAHATLPRADVAVLVVGPEPPIGAQELQYARDVVASSEHLFVVLNKSDIAGASLPELLRFTRDAIEHVVSKRQDTDVIALSATRARDAQRKGGEDPQFAEFMSSLRSFVENQGDATRERSLRRRAEALLQRLEALVAMRSAALSLPIAERMQRKSLVERALEIVDDRARSLELMVDDDVRRLRPILEEAIDGFHDRDLARFRSLARDLSDEPSVQRRGERLERAIAEHASAWRANSIELAARRLQSDAEKYGRLLGEIETSALEAGCEVLHVDPGTLTSRSVEFAPANLELAASLTPTTGLELVVGSATELLPGPMRKAILMRRYDDLLAREMDALRGRLRYSIFRNLEPWRRSVRATIASSIENVRSAVLSAFGEVATATDAGEERNLDRIRQLEQELRSIKAMMVERVPVGDGA